MQLCLTKIYLGSSEIQARYPNHYLYGVYMYDADEKTHCCELSPSYWCVFLYYSIESLSVHTPAELWSELDESYEEDCYINCDHVIFRHACSEVDLDSADDNEERWQTAIEYYRSNHHM